MLWKLHLPFQRKAALACLFCSGIFIVICTILRNYYNLGDNTNQFLGQVWAGRECFVCMIVVSAPGIWPLLRKLRVLGTSLYASNTSGNVYKSGSRRWKASAARASMRKSGVPQDFQMLSRSKHRGAGAERLDSRIDEEPIVKEEREGEGEGEGEGQSSQTSSPTLRGIEVTTEYTVRYDEERAEPSTSASAAAAEQWPEDRRN
jgi:hypothetical protein